MDLIIVPRDLKKMIEYAKCEEEDEFKTMLSKLETQPKWDICYAYHT